MDDESSFSIELISRDYLNEMTLNGNRSQGLVLEGSLGVITDIEFQGGSVFVLRGSNGILRLDLEEDILMEKLRLQRVRK